ncbi:MAG: thiol-disulfide oxidoreductase DCC family protein [Bacteroidota bacterium]
MSWIPAMMNEVFLSFGTSMEKSVILFDGVCNYCNRVVNFIIEHDKNSRFVFAPLQSEAGQKILKNLGLRNIQIDTLILLEGDKIYSHSTAALRIFRQLPAPINWLYVGIVFPRFLRDAVYKIIAKNRHRILGKRNECMVPDDRQRDKFLH